MEKNKLKYGSWDLAISEQQAIADAGGAVESRALTDQEIEDNISQRVADAAPIGLGIAIGLILMTLVLTTARGVAPRQDFRPLAIGFAGVALGLVMDIVFVTPRTSAGVTLILMVLPMALIFYGLRTAVARLAENELIRVVFPPLILIVAVLP